MATCKVCERTASKRGMCDSHYRRWLKYGDPLGGVRARRCKNGAPMEWIEQNAHLEHGDECLLWPFSREPRGYGRLVIHEGKQRQPHNIMARLVYGNPPEGKEFTLHSCNNPPCVNPRHLRWGSPQENSRDAVIAGRLMHGERHLSAKLSPADVMAIRSSDEPGYVLAEIYKVNPSTINRARSKRNWKSL